MSTKPIRNVVLCLDGTCNKFCNKNTNVVKLFSLLQADELQLLYYDSGVGSYPSEHTVQRGGLKEHIVRTVDMALAIDFPMHVASAYQWLCDYYNDGDLIWIFGFSRGAYTARVLAGMIDHVGLLPKGNHSQVQMAWQVFRDAMDERSLEGMEEAYRQTFSRSAHVCVHFVGVWDTVASLGGRDAPRLPFATGAGSVRHFRHALALDERRVNFEPEYFVPDKPREFHDDGHGLRKADESHEEVWFAGCHCDVGGGEELDTNAALSNIPLRWMMREAIDKGIRISKVQVAKSPIYKHLVDDTAAAQSLDDRKFWVDKSGLSIVLHAMDARSIVEAAAFRDLHLDHPSAGDGDVPASDDVSRKIHESLSGLGGLYRFMELLPGLDPDGLRPHFGTGRNIRKDQRIHPSVVNRIDDIALKYRPAAQLPVDDWQGSVWTTQSGGSGLSSTYTSKFKRKEYPLSERNR